MAIIRLIPGDEAILEHFKPPTSWNKLTKEEQSCNKWLERKHHGLSWEKGSTPYSFLMKILQRSLYNAQMVYVKGHDKKSWLQEIVHET